jgi:hypothetical protein
MVVMAGRAGRNTGYLAGFSRPTHFAHPLIEAAACVVGADGIEPPTFAL